jgi:hypothetical protein
MIALVLGMALSLQDANETAAGAATKKEVTQVALNAIADECMAPRTWLKLLATDRVRFDAPSKAPYEMVSCLIRRIKDSGLPVTIDMAGNGQPVPPEGRR